MEIWEDEFSIDFWRFDHIQEEEFMKQAQSGDILLFRNNQKGGMLSKKSTNANSDHAAIVVKVEQAKGTMLFMLEAVPKRGVCLTSWDNFRNLNMVYDEVFYRKLNCNRDK